MSKRKIPWKCYVCGKDYLIGTSTYNKLMSGKQKTSCCSRECSNKLKLNGKELPCEYCGEKVYFTQSRIDKTEHHFCSLDCEMKYRSKSVREVKKCEICNKEFIALKRMNQRFCSIECQGKWQSTIVGELNSRYKRISTNCSWCNKEIKVKPYKMKENQNHFCDKKCCRQWFDNVYYQTDEWKNSVRERFIKTLLNNEKRNKEYLNTTPQLKVNEFLNELNIKYTREYIVKYYAIDNYLDDYNLMIEVNGDYWHGNPMKYNNKINKIQATSIRSDKAKHTYITKYYDVKILYLWETDINKNPILCKKLIEKYVSNKGILSNYNSFNYELRDNKLFLKDEIIKSYQEQDFEFYNKLIS